MPTVAGTAYLRPAVESFRPPEHIEVDDWIERNIILPELTCPEPGPMRISRTPYMRGPLRAFADPYIEHLVLVMGRQVAKSQGMLYPCMAYTIDQDPGPSLFLLPSKELGEYTSKNRLQPMFDLCRAVQEKKTSNRDDYTTLEMKFQNMVLSVAGGGSATQTMSRPVRYLYRDEIDELKAGVGTDETDPLKSSEETTSNFPNRKIVDTSTPTRITGNIWKQLQTCQFVFEYWVPCPHCGLFFVIICGELDGAIIGNIDIHGETDPEKAATVADLRCPHCQEHTKNHQKTELLAGGKWRARTTPDPCKQILENMVPKIEDTVALEEVLNDPGTTKIGFHLPKWYSPFAHGTFGACAKELMQAQGDYLKMAQWSKFWAARPYQEQVEGMKMEESRAHVVSVPAGICPENTIAVTVGMDPGQKGFWWTAWAWLPHHVMHLIAYRHQSLIGLQLDEQIEVYRRLIFDTRFPSESGQFEYPVWRAGMDTGGGKTKNEPMTQTAKAYAIIRGVVNAQRRVETNPRMVSLAERRFLATKGDTGSDKSMRESKIDKGPDGKPIPGGLTLWIMNVNMIKSSFAHAFNLEPGKHGSVTLNNGHIDEFIQHISAEELQQNKKGVWEWVQKPRTENHLLDCTVNAWGVGADECWGGVTAVKRAQREPAAVRPEREAIANAEFAERILAMPRQQQRPTAHRRRVISRGIE